VDKLNEMAQWMAGLVGARDFEEAGAHVLRSLMDVAEQAVASSPYAGRARLLRGMVHMRPGEGYRRLAVLEWKEGKTRQGAGASPESDVSEPLLTSMAAPATTPKSWPMSCCRGLAPSSHPGPGNVPVSSSSAGTAAMLPPPVM
jgi:hypothetical protein